MADDAVPVVSRLVMGWAETCVEHMPVGEGLTLRLAMVLGLDMGLELARRDPEHARLLRAAIDAEIGNDHGSVFESALEGLIYMTPRVVLTAADKEAALLAVVDVEPGRD